MPREIKLRLNDQFFDRRNYFRGQMKAGGSDPTQIISQTLNENPDLLGISREILRDKWRG